MALLRANEAGLPAETQAGSMLPFQPAPIRRLTGAADLLWLAQGLEAKARELLAGYCVGNAGRTALRRLHRAGRVRGGCEPRARPPGRAGGRFERLKTTCRSIARIHAEILSRGGGGAPPYQAYLARNRAGYWRSIHPTHPDAPALGARAGEVSTPSSALGCLQAAGTGARRPSAWSGSWILRPRTSRSPSRRPRAEGSWTEGRAVAMKRLHERDPGSTT